MLSLERLIFLRLFIASSGKNGFANVLRPTPKNTSGYFDKFHSQHFYILLTWIFKFFGVENGNIWFKNFQDLCKIFTCVKCPASNSLHPPLIKLMNQVFLNIPAQCQWLQDNIILVFKPSNLWSNEFYSWVAKSCCMLVILHAIATIN